MSDSFERRRQALEEEFFKKQNQALLEKLRNQLEATQPKAVLRKITGIDDEKVLDTLVALHVNHETLAAFALYPLVEVAWADGRVEDRERARAAKFRHVVTVLKLEKLRHPLHVAEPSGSQLGMQPRVCTARKALGLHARLDASHLPKCVR